MLWECGQNTRELSIGYFRECHTSLGEICSSLVDSLKSSSMAQPLLSRAFPKFILKWKY